MDHLLTMPPDYAWQNAQNIPTPSGMTQLIVVWISAQKIPIIMATL